MILKPQNLIETFKTFLSYWIVAQKTIGPRYFCSTLWTEDELVTKECGKISLTEHKSADQEKSVFILRKILKNTGLHPASIFSHTVNDQLSS